MQDALPAVGSPSIESPATESIANKGVKDEGVEIKGWGGVTPVIEGVKVRQRQARLSLPNIFSSPPRIAAEKDGLIKACKSKKKNVQKILYIIERQPELILVKDADGKLPVHHAASRMPVEVIDALVFPHRDTIFEKDEAGKTAFDYASAYYAAEPVVIALNDKRRKLRDEKARQEREAQAQLERDKLAKGEAEVEDFKREAAEEIDDILKSLIDLNNTFCKNSNENTTPFDMGTVEKMEALVMSVKDKAGEAHAKIESKRLEDFFDKKKRAVEEINEKTRTWAKRVKTLVRANKTLEQDTDCYSKVMVQVTLDDPIANRLTENDDNVDKINYVKFDAGLKEMGWRLGRVKLATKLQTYLARLRALRKSWDARKENMETFNIHEFTEDVATVINDGAKVEKHFNKVILDVQEGLATILKDLRMRGVGGGNTPKAAGNAKRRHSFAS